MSEPWSWTKTSVTYFNILKQVLYITSLSAVVLSLPALQRLLVGI